MHSKYMGREDGRTGSFLRSRCSSCPGAWRNIFGDGCLAYANVHAAVSGCNWRDVRSFLLAERAAFLSPCAIKQSPLARGLRTHPQSVQSVPPSQFVMSVPTSPS